MPHQEIAVPTSIPGNPTNESAPARPESQEVTRAAGSPYRVYWIAWLVLLALTLVMINIHSRPVLLAGIGLKSIIIGWWFMHLNHERRGFAAMVVVAGLFYVLFMFALMAFDVSRMVPAQ